MHYTWSELTQLASQYGESFYILDLDRFRENFKNLEDAFRCLYRKTSIAYSYKTNYIPHLCELANRLGGYAEVVSSTEYKLARRLGVEPGRIIFNGPVKSRDDLLRVFKNGGMVNLDSPYECELVRSIAEERPGMKCRMGIRCNFQLPGSDRSHFGFAVENGELERAIKAIAALKNCSIIGIQCHFSSTSRDVRSYAFRMNTMLAIMDRYFPGRHLQYIDIGGGFFGKVDPFLKKQWPGQVPSFRDYAKAITAPLRQRFRNEKIVPELILEPGIALAGDVLQYATRILGTKTIDRRTLAITAGSVFHLKPTQHGKNMPLRIVAAPAGNRRQRKTSGPVDLIGCTCMEKDVLHQGCREAIGPGDFALFRQAGGYTIVLSPPFISPFPAILAVSSSKRKPLVARRPGAFRDMFSGFHFKREPNP